MPLDDITNFVAVSEQLGTAGQPSEEQLREVADAGFEVVVNLGLLDPRYCLVTKPGPWRVSVSRITTSRWTSTRRSLTICGGSSTRWTPPDQGDEHIRRIWEPNDTWTRFIAERAGAWRLNVDPTAARLRVHRIERRCATATVMARGETRSRRTSSPPRSSSCHH